MSERRRSRENPEVRAEVATSKAAAARLIGLSAFVITSWLGKGWLGPPPWTLDQLEAAAAKSRNRVRRGPTSEHGTESRRRAGCRCRECCDGWAKVCRARRQEAREALWAGREKPLFIALAAGLPFVHACAQSGVTPQAVTFRRRQNENFRRGVEAALMAGRDPALPHGSNNGWRAGCRCPDCRACHEASR